MKDYKEFAELATRSIEDMDERMTLIDREMDERKEQAFEKAKRELKVLISGWSRGDFIDMLDRCDFGDDPRVPALTAICLAESDNFLTDKQKDDLHDFAHSLMAHAAIDAIANQLFGKKEKEEE